MSISEFIEKIKRKWMKLCLQPIRVFCLHHVCEQFDAEAMYPCDWMALDEFKQKIIALRNQGYQFISLTEAYKHLKTDCFRNNGKKQKKCNFSHKCFQKRKKNNGHRKTRTNARPLAKAKQNEGRGEKRAAR